MPTVATESVFVTAAVVSHEGQYVSTLNITGVYLRTETYKGVITLMEGALADLVVKVAPKVYLKYVIRIRKGKPLLYIQIQKSLYGLL